MYHILCVLLFQVQAEALRVELKEKQNLLCEAAAALELMEQSIKSNEAAYQSTIDELNSKIQFLENNLVGFSPPFFV